MDRSSEVVEMADSRPAVAEQPTDRAEAFLRRDRDAITDELNDLGILGLDGTWIGQVTQEPSSDGTYWWAPAAGS